MRKSRTLGMTAAFLVALFALPLGAQELPAFRDSLLDRLDGHWVLRGTITGQATTHDVTAEWVFGHQFLRLHEVARERNAAGAPAYEAEAYIGRDATTHDLTCIWLDIYGTLDSHSVGYATRARDSMQFAFHAGDGSTFITTFAYDRATDSWTTNMDSGTPGKMTPFARTTLSRAQRK